VGDIGDAGDAGDGYMLPTSLRVFITSLQWTANLGGAAGADAKCQAAANGASLGGTWMAWLSTSTSTPDARFTHSTVPYKLLDGTLIANDWADLTSGALENPINRDEHDAVVNWFDMSPYTYGYTGIAWTSTYTNGKSMLTNGATSNCSDFSDGTSDNGPYAVVGYNGNSGGYQGFMWTDAQVTSGYACDYILSLLCFEQ
jgi:hypothetical protein